MGFINKEQFLTNVVVDMKYCLLESKHKNSNIVDIWNFRKNRILEMTKLKHYTNVLIYRFQKR